MQKNKMGLIKEYSAKLKKDPWYKRLRRWLKFKLWLLKNKIK